MMYTSLVVISGRTVDGNLTGAGDNAELLASMESKSSSCCGPDIRTYTNRAASAAALEVQHVTMPCCRCEGRTLDYRIPVKGGQDHTTPASPSPHDWQHRRQRR